MGFCVNRRSYLLWSPVKIVVGIAVSRTCLVYVYCTWYEAVYALGSLGTDASYSSVYQEIVFDIVSKVSDTFMDTFIGKPKFDVSHRTCFFFCPPSPAGLRIPRHFFFLHA